MKNTIIKLFNLEPTAIRHAEVITEGDDTFVLVTLAKRVHACPSCGKATSQIHDYRERVITHAILNDVDTTIVFNQRRYYCGECHKRFPEHNPFAMHGKRISKYTVLRVMKMLRNPRITFTYAAKDVGISVSSVIRIFDEHAAVTPMDLPEAICIDEVYAVKYTQRTYACVLTDFVTCQIYDVLPDRKKYTLANYFTTINRSSREKVLYVCMDMWDPYRELAEVYFPNAKVCIDSFHVIKLINYAFNKVRIRIMNQYDRNSEEYRLLKRYAWVLNKNSSDLDRENYMDLRRYYATLGTRYIRQHVLVSQLIADDPELEVAYMLKNEYSEINQTATAENISRRLDAYIDDLKVYNIKEFRSVRRTLIKWHDEIINSFDKLDERRLSNGPAESTNSRIKLIKSTGNGYRNFERFKLRILYSLNDGSSIKF